MKLRVLYHGNCFDGSASAALFARFFRERLAQGTAEVAYTPMHHKGEPQPIAGHLLDGDLNACVDFRYSQHARLDWWFDHHASAFQLAGDEAHFRADTSGRKFYDPHAKSCTRFMAEALAAKFGWDIARFAELIHWAEIIDGALFPSAAMAVELREPALRLMTWVENNRERPLAERFIEDLVARPLAEIAADALRDSQRLRGEGDAQAASVLARAYGANPEFAAFYRSLQAYRNVLVREGDVLVVQPDGEFYKYLHNPARH